MDSISPAGAASPDLIVIGSGAAAWQAAQAAASYGMHVVLIDDLTDEHASPPSPEPPLFRHSAGRRVWMVQPGFTVHCWTAQGLEIYTAARLILAVPHYQRQVPFSGNTVTIDVKVTGPVLFAGAGPALIAAAATALRRGESLAGVADAAQPGAWPLNVPPASPAGASLAQAEADLALLREADIPLWFGFAITSAKPKDDGALCEVTLTPLDTSWRSDSAKETVAVAAARLVVGYDDLPDNRFALFLGATHHRDELTGGWLIKRDPQQRSDVPGLYVIDPAPGWAVGSARDAAAYLAGITAAADAGLIAAAEASAASAPWLALAEALAEQTALMVPLSFQANLYESMTPDSIVCGCEAISLATLDDAIADGATEPNQLKRDSGCGMGQCQTLLCGDALTWRLNRRRGAAPIHAPLRPRPPFHPVPVRTLIGEFDYAKWALPRKVG